MEAVTPMQATDEHSPMIPCECCGKKEPTEVRASALGAVSFRYCHDCLISGREPYSAIMATVWIVGGWQNLDESLRKNFRSMLNFYGKSEDGVIREAAELEAQYMADMARLDEQADKSLDDLWDEIGRTGIQLHSPDKEDDGA